MKFIKIAFCSDSVDWFSIRRVLSSNFVTEETILT